MREAHVDIPTVSPFIEPLASYEGRHRWDPWATWTAAEERRVVLKTDLLLLSWLCIMFFMLQLDRGNVSNALADRLLEDLGMTSDDYNNGSTLQVACFLTAEFPVQFATKRLGFRVVLPTMMLLWGTVSWAQAFVTNRAGFYVTRALIGLFEGGFLPGAVLFATYFYTGRELSRRLAVFWSTLNVARLCSALLAAVILDMRGVGGRPGWFWLFMIEGVMTCICALLSFAYLPASPTDTKGAFRPSWYTEREEVIMVNRILRDDPAKGLTSLKQPVTLADMHAAWTDPSMWGLYFIGLVAYIPAAPVAAYLTLTLRRMGFSTFNSNMLTAPSALLQIMTGLALAWSSDHFQDRAFHCLVGELCMAPWLVAVLALPDGGREWTRFSLMTLTTGYPYFHPIVSAWISENTFDVKKRAITAATYNVAVQIGSLVGSQIYRVRDAPYYHAGNAVCLAFCVVSVAAVLVQRRVLVAMNLAKDRAWTAMTSGEREAYMSDTAARERDGNKRLDFRFVY